MPAIVECLVEDAPGRPDERVPLEVLLVARLLADKHQRRRDGPVAEDRLGRPLPELAAPAIGRVGPDRGKSSPGGRSR